MLLRGFLGGVRDAEAMTLTDEEMVETVKRDMAGILGLRGQPVMTPGLPLAGRHAAARGRAPRADGGGRAGGRLGARAFS